MMGVPARQTGWMSRHGHPLKSSDNGVMTCPESGLRYREIAQGLLKCIDLDEEARLPEGLSVGGISYRELKAKP
jgi:UDP-2-acetamido-3-amino-2,3-dideoxy-glucuronate N-acetyltransferase